MTVTPQTSEGGGGAGEGVASRQLSREQGETVLQPLLHLSAVHHPGCSFPAGELRLRKFLEPNLSSELQAASAGVSAGPATEQPGESSVISDFYSLAI